MVISLTKEFRGNLLLFPRGNHVSPSAIESYILAAIFFTLLPCTALDPVRLHITQ